MKRWFHLGALVAPFALGLASPVEAQRFSPWSPAANLGPAVNTTVVDG